jgi:hypothetical protein
MVRQLPHSAEVAFKVLVSIFFPLSFIATVLRLLRRRSSRLWYDDYFAAIAAVDGLATFMLYWMQLEPHGALGTVRSMKARYWAWFLTSRTTLWFARFSIAFGAARIFPAESRARKFAFGLVFLYFLFVSSSILMFFGLCGPERYWVVRRTGVSCKTPDWRAYFTVSTHIIADTSLVAFGLFFLLTSKVPLRLRQLIMACFVSAAILLSCTIVIFTFTVAPASWEPLKGAVASWLITFQLPLAILVANSVVLASYFYSRVHGATLTVLMGNQTTVHNLNADEKHESDSESGKKSHGSEKYMSYDPDTMRTIETMGTINA